MEFNLDHLLKERHGENFQLHAKYLNPQLTKVIKTLGFDRFYEHGEGCYLIDDEGRRYLDLLSGFGVFALGRSHPVIKDALHQALDADLPNMAQMDCALLPGLLAEQLVTRSPKNIDRVVFGNSGAEAVEAAIKFARAATGRARVCYQSHAYHGLTIGALSVNGSADFKSGFGPLVPGAVEVPFGDIDALRRELRAGDVAAFIAEPIQGKGVYRLEAEQWREIEAAVHDAGALFICDEVQTGIGRTGRFYAFEHYGLDARHHHRVQGAVGRLRAGRGDAGQSTRSCAACTARWTGRWCTRQRSRATSSRWSPASPPWQVFDDEHVVAHAAAMGDLWKARLGELARVTSSSTTCAARAR